jgi:hypothetical protein
MWPRLKNLRVVWLAGVPVVMVVAGVLSSGSIQVAAQEPAATSPAPLYIVRAVGGPTGFTNPPALNPVWLSLAKNRYYGPTFRLTNVETHAILPWSVRVQVRSTGAGTDGTGWDTVFDDYWTGRPGMVQPGAVGEFRVKPPLKSPWRVCIIYSTDWTDTFARTNLIQKSFSGQYEVISREFAGDVTGKVTLSGTPPAEIVIQPLMDDRVLGPMHKGIVTTRHYLVSADMGLADMFVYVKAGLEGRKFEPPLAELVLDQIGGLFEPYISGVMVGQKFKLRDSDPVMANMHIAGRINPGRNVALVAKGQEVEMSFDHPELMVRVHGDVYNWMSAYVNVVDNPFFAVTDAKGRFKISGLPPGKYTLEFVHQGAGKTTKEIEVRYEEEKADVELRVPGQ